MVAVLLSGYNLMPEFAHHKNDESAELPEANAINLGRIPVAQSDIELVKGAISADFNDHRESIVVLYRELAELFCSKTGEKVLRAICRRARNLVRHMDGEKWTGDALIQLREGSIEPRLIALVRDDLSILGWMPGAAQDVAAMRFVHLGARDLERGKIAVGNFLKSLVRDLHKKFYGSESVDPLSPELQRLGRLVLAHEGLCQDMLREEFLPLVTEIIRGFADTAPWPEVEREASQQAMPLDIVETGRQFQDRWQNEIVAHNLSYSPAAYELRIEVANWVVGRFARMVAKDENLIECLKTFHDLVQQAENICGIEIEAFDEVHEYRLEPEKLYDPKYTDQCIREAAGAFSCKGLKLILVHVRCDSDSGLRELDQRNPIEAKLLQRIAGAYIEEYLHAIQFLSVKRHDCLRTLQIGSSADSSGMEERRESGIISSLMRQYLRGQSPASLAALTDRDICETDVVARMIELFKEAGIDAANLHLECFDYHFSTRLKFVEWAIKEQILPADIVPAYFWEECFRAYKLEEGR